MDITYIYLIKVTQEISSSIDYNVLHVNSCILEAEIHTYVYKPKSEKEKAVVHKFTMIFILLQTSFFPLSCQVNSLMYIHFCILDLQLTFLPLCQPAIHLQNT